MTKPKLKLTNTKGVAQKLPPKRGNRSHKKKVDAYADRDVYKPPSRKTSGRSILDNATSSFKATSSGNVYEPDPSVDPRVLGLDSNGGIEFRSGNTPSGLFSDDEDIPYTPDHVTNNKGPTMERGMETPEPPSLDGMFTPDAPQMALSKKVVTRFVSDYGEKVPKSAREGNYRGPSISAEVVKTFVPCYIVQMPKSVRERIYSLVLFPRGKAKAPRPHFSHCNNWRLKTPALLHTCQEIRRETSRLYYSSITVTALQLHQLLPWLKLLDRESRAALRKVSLPFEPWDHVYKTKEQQIEQCLQEFKKAGVELHRQRFDLVVAPPDVERSLGGDLTEDEA